jgi:hypothetical protein
LERPQGEADRPPVDPNLVAAAAKIQGQRSKWKKKSLCVRESVEVSIFLAGVIPLDTGRAAMHTKFSR